MFNLRQLERAHEIVAAAVPPTPAHAWPLLAQRLGTAVVVSMTTMHRPGPSRSEVVSLEIQRLSREGPRPRGLTSATRCNHGQSAGLCRTAGPGIPVTIVCEALWQQRREELRDAGAWRSSHRARAPESKGRARGGHISRGV